MIYLLLVRVMSHCPIVGANEVRYVRDTDCLFEVFPVFRVFSNKQSLDTLNQRSLNHLTCQQSQRGGAWSLSEWIMGTPNLHGSHPVL